MLNNFIKSSQLIFFLLLPILVLAESQTSINIGAALPLTGNLSSYGDKIRQGIELAIEDSPHKDFVKFSPEDAPMSGGGVITIFNTLIGAKKVKALAGNFSNVAMLTMAPLLQKNEIVAMHTAALDNDILAASNGWIFSTNTRIRDEGARLAQYAYNTLNSRSAAVITIDSNFGIGYRDSFVKEFTRLGGKIVADEKYQLGEVDYKAQLIRIKSANPDLLFGATFGHFLGLTLKQKKELGITCPTLSVYESEDPSVIEAAQGTAEGLRYFVSYSPIVNERGQKVRAKYKEKFGGDAGTFQLDAYDATTLLIEAMAACKSDPTCVRESLLKVKDYDGVSGKLSIEADGASKKEFFLKEIKFGKFEFNN